MPATRSAASGRNGLGKQEALVRSRSQVFRKRGALVFFSWTPSATTVICRLLARLRMVSTMAQLSVSTFRRWMKERSILSESKLQRAQAAKRGIAGAEVVQLKADVQGAKPRQDFSLDRIKLRYERALGNFQVERPPAEFLFRPSTPSTAFGQVARRPIVLTETLTFIDNGAARGNLVCQILSWVDACRRTQFPKGMIRPVSFREGNEI